MGWQQKLEAGGQECPRSFTNICTCDMHTVMRRVMIIAAMVASTAAASAQRSEPLVTDRPDQTESATTVRPGKVQIEMGGSIEIDTLETGAQRDYVVTSAPDALFRIGVVDGFEARVGTAWVRESYDQFDANAPGGLTTRVSNDRLEGHLGGKVSIREDEKEGFSLAVLGGVDIPFEEGLPLSVEIRGALAQEISSVFSLGVNLGGTLIDGDLGGFYTLVAGVGLNESLGTFVELYGDMPWQEEAAQSFDTGLTWSVTDNLQLDIAAGFGLNRDASDAMAGIGFSWRLPD